MYILPEVLIDYIWSFVDIDTRLLNNIQPKKIQTNFTLKAPYHIFSCRKYIHFKICEEYFMVYYFKERQTLINSNNVSIRYNKNWKSI